MIPFGVPSNILQSKTKQGARAHCSSFAVHVMAESSCFILVLTVAPAARARNSGLRSARERLRCRSPSWCSTALRRRLLGPSSSSAVAWCRVTQGATFVIGAAAAALCSPVPLVGGDALCRSAVFKLRPEVEQRVRLSTTPSGDALSFKLRAFAGSTWRVMRFSGDAYRTVVGLTAGGTCQMPQSVARLIGIKPDVVDSHASSIADVEAAFDEFFRLS